MSQLAVVTYPVLSDDDRRWIEGLRARHDPQARRIAAHITLVFPAEMAQADLVAQTRSALQGRDSFSVVLRHAVALPNATRVAAACPCRSAMGMPSCARSTTCCTAASSPPDPCSIVAVESFERRHSYLPLRKPWRSLAPTIAR